MGEADRDENLHHSGIVQFGAVVVSEGGRRWADVHGHVPDFTAGTADELGLPRMGLEMQTAQGAARRSAMVILNEGVPDARRFEGGPVIAFLKPSAVIPENLRREQEQSFQWRLYRIHGAQK